MPCYDDRDSPSEVRASALKEFEHNSPVAEMLCAVMQILHPQDRPRVADMVPGLTKWWADHQARDKAKNDNQTRRDS